MNKHRHESDKNIEVDKYEADRRARYKLYLHQGSDSPPEQRTDTERAQLLLYSLQMDVGRVGNAGAFLRDGDEPMPFSMIKKERDSVFGSIETTRDYDRNAEYARQHGAGAFTRGHLKGTVRKLRKLAELVPRIEESGKGDSIVSDYKDLLKDLKASSLYPRLTKVNGDAMQRIFGSVYALED